MASAVPSAGTIGSEGAISGVASALAASDALHVFNSSFQSYSFKPPSVCRIFSTLRTTSKFMSPPQETFCPRLIIPMTHLLNQILKQMSAQMLAWQAEHMRECPAYISMDSL
jgi:hypothetical protein